MATGFASGVMGSFQILGSLAAAVVGSFVQVLCYYMCVHVYSNATCNCVYIRMNMCVVSVHVYVYVYVCMSVCVCLCTCV